MIKSKKINFEYIRKQRELNHLIKSKMADLMGLKTTEKYSRRENGEYNFQVDELPCPKVLSLLGDVQYEMILSNKLLEE